MIATRSLPAHVQSAAIVVDEARLIYVPIPKAGSTGVLWWLLDLVDISGDAFRGSAKLETTRSLTIHDTLIWGRSHVLEGRVSDPYALFEADEWFTFTLVRDPVRRLWSAWVSKILVRDPRFVRLYGGESWFPDPPETANDVVGSFRAFLATLSERPADWHDPHWSSQVELAGTDVLAYDLIARVERLPVDLDPVAHHVERHGRTMSALRRENSSLLPFAPELLDPDSWARCAALTARDRAAFGYAMPEQTAGDSCAKWVGDVVARLPGVRAVIERNERIGDLKQLLGTRSR